MATVDIIQLLKSDEGEKFYPVTHKNAVIGLEDSSFFEAVQDENDSTKFSVKLKSEYTGLWADGWIAAGGVGSGGSGGGGASYLNDLEDVNAPTPTLNDVLSWNGSSWVNSSNYYTKAQVDSMVSTSLTPVVADSLPTASIATMYKLYFVPSSDPQAGNMKDEYITVFDGTDYTWEQVGSTAVDLSGKQDTLISGTNIQTLNSHSILNSGDYPIGDLTLMPNMDNVTPKRTIEYDLASTAWFPIFKRTNTGVSSIDDVVDRLLFRITMTGTGIHHVMDCLILFRPLINTSPVFYYWNSSISTSATYLGLYQMRLIYPKVLNSGYDWAFEAYAYKNATRHIKIEVFQDTEDITWLTTPTSSIYNSTYHTSGGNHTLSTLGFRSYTYLNVNVDYATSSAYLASYLPVFPGNGNVFTSGAALASGNAAFMSTDGLLYPVSNTSKPIRPEMGIFLMGTSYDANKGIGYAYVRDKGATITFANTSATYGTFAKGDEIYLRCTMSNGQIYSDGYLSTTPTSGYTWISIGIAQSATAGGYSMVGKSFFTLDSNGGLTHVNGNAITDYGLTDRVEALEDLFEIVDGNVHVKNGRGLYSDSWIAAGGIGSGGGGGGSVSYLSDLEDVDANNPDTNDLLRWNGTAWVNVPQSSIMPTLSVVVPSTGNALTGVTYSNGVFTYTTGTFLTSVPDLSSTYLSLADGGTVQDNVVFNEYIEGPNSVWYIGDDGVCKFSDIEYINSIRLHGLLDGGTLSGDTFTQKWSITNAGVASFSSLSVGGSSVLTGVKMNGSNVTVTDGIANLGTVITSHQTVSNNAATLSAGQTVTIATIGSTNITVTVPSFALASALSNYVPTTRTINGVDLSVNRTFYIGTSQVQSSSQAQAIEGISSIKLSSADSLFSWDSQNHAWHFAGNMYADGWIAAGGIGEDSGGGYGVEEITTNQDGTVDFHFTGGDVTTVDLNHEHPQYPKYVLCANQAAYDAITTKESDTLYLIPETT